MPLLFLLAMSLQAAPPDTIVVNGRVWTGSTVQPWAEALAVSAGRITAVGQSAEVRKLAGDRTRIIDARGGLVAPGFIDSHLHFIEGGFRLSSVQLRSAKSRAEFAERIRAFAANVPKGGWITGGDWDHTTWGGELPSRGWIDEVTPDHPVWINRLDGHMALANSAALRAAKVTSAITAPHGGEIVRNAKGEPTGILKDNAMLLVDRVVPEPSSEMTDRALDAAIAHVAARGVTSVQHMGTWSDLEAFERARRSGRLRTRVYAAVPLDTWERLRDKVAREGRGDEWLHWGALKGYVDGSLGSHTAAFLEPFSDAPDSRGLLVSTPENLNKWISGAANSGLHVVVHAIGDRANRTLLDIYESVLRESRIDAQAARFRVEHAQHIAPSDIARFGKLGVIASMQPYHTIDDGRWAEKVIGAERAKTSYAFRSLLDSGARLAFGSDWFVAPATPLEGIFAAVARQTLDDRHPGGWVPEQRIKVEEALRAYTRDPAYAEFAEKDKGVLEPGKLADFVILRRDITKIASHEIAKTQVVMTVVGGNVVYEAR